MLLCRLLELELELTKSKKMTYAKGTTKNIKCQWLSFITFCISFKLQYIPAKVHTICLYAQYLSTKFVSVQSISNYIHGVKLLHLYVGVSSPQTNDFSINLTLKGITRRLNHTPRQAAPITPHMLIQFRAHMDILRQYVPQYGVHFSSPSTLWHANPTYAQYPEMPSHPPNTCAAEILSTHNPEWLWFINGQKPTSVDSDDISFTLAPNVTEPVVCPLQAFNNMTRVVPASAQSHAFLVPDSKIPHKLTTLTHERPNTLYINLCFVNFCVYVGL